MAASGKSKRRYHSPHRQSRSRETRSAILDAAYTLFMKDGWPKTTIAAIAHAASVSNETIYASFGSKRAILQSLVERSIRGAAPDTPLLEQPGPQAIIRAADQNQQIALFAADITAILDRVAPLIAVVRAAAESEPEMESLYAALHRGRRKNLEFVADALLTHGPLRAGLDRSEAAGLIWRLTSPELFLLIRRMEKRSLTAYRDWLADSLARSLLD